jgi:hypothetical protein
MKATNSSHKLNKIEQQKNMQTNQIINCFYKCSFTTNQNHLMETLQQKHYPKGKEVSRE